MEIGYLRFGGAMNGEQKCEKRCFQNSKADLPLKVIGEAVEPIH